MKKTLLLCALAALFTINAFAQQRLPVQLLGNWLSPKTNEWKFGFTNKYAVADGSFWNYTIKSRKANKLVLTLSDGKVSKQLFITLNANKTANIGYAENSLMLYTTTYNEQADYAYYDKTGFKAPLLKTDTVHFSGVLNGYDKNRDKYQYISLIYVPLLEKEQKIYTIKVDSLGRFSTAFPMMNPQEVRLAFSNELTEFYAVPSDHLMASITINRKNKLATMDDYLTYITTRQAVLFMGKDALFNVDFNNFSYRLRKIRNFQVDTEKQKTPNQQEFKAYRVGKMNEMLDSLSAYAHRHHSGKTFTQYFEQFIRFDAANDLLRYGWLNGRKNLTLDHLSFIKQLPHNNELNLVTENYAKFLDELSVLGYYEGVEIKSPQIEDVIAMAKAKGYTFKPGEEGFAKFNITIVAKGPDSLMIYFPPNSNVGEDLQKALFAGAKKIVDDQKEVFRQRMLEAQGIEAGSLSNDILLAKKAFQKISETNGLDDKELAQIKEQINRPELFDALALHNQELKAKVNGAMPAQAHLITGLQKEQNNLLETLLSKYKGKVIYIDFWAPWCGPCMGEMPASKILRKELAGKDVVFLYLGVNCSEDSWSKTIKTSEIEGEHYLLSKDEYALLSGRLQITGIPRYLLIDKQGNIANDQAKRPSNKTELLADINQLLQ